VRRLTAHREVLSFVVLPETTEQVQALVRACHAHAVPFFARGGRYVQSELAAKAPTRILFTRMLFVIRVLTRRGARCL